MANEKKVKIPKIAGALARSGSKDNRVVVPEQSQGITKEKLERFLPKGTSIKVTDDILDTLRNMEKDTDLPQNLMEEEVMSYMHLVGRRQGTGLEDLIKAVKFCNLKRFMSNAKAWEIVFPVKANERKAKGLDIDQFAAMYNTRSVLVKEIDKQMIMPFSLQYNAYAHEAMNITMSMARGRTPASEDHPRGEKVSPMVMYLCAKEILANTKVEEDKTIQLKVGLTDEAKDSRDRIATQMAATALAIQQAIANGAKVEDVQALNLSHEDALSGSGDDEIEDAEYEDNGATYNGTTDEDYMYEDR